MEYSLAGCVILYNPEEDVRENIASYIDSLEMLYVVDNHGGTRLIEKLQQLYPHKIKALRHAENMGIAASLNEALAEARGKYDLLLTMDQDSRFYRDCMKIYAEEAQKFAWEETLGIGPERVASSAATPDCTKVEWGGTASV